LDLLEVKRVLVVEDNPEDETLTLRALRACDIPSEILVARDGDEAWQQLDRAHPTDLPHLILLDLKLPKLSGLDLLKLVRAKDALRHIPVILLTSSNEERDVSDSYSAGANSYVQKPVDYDAFIETVRQVGAYWLACNETL
jgi:two-component system response regulator